MNKRRKRKEGDDEMNSSKINESDNLRPTKFNEEGFTISILNEKDGDTYTLRLHISRGKRIVPAKRKDYKMKLGQERRNLEELTPYSKQKEKLNFHPQKEQKNERFTI